MANFHSAPAHEPTGPRLRSILLLAITLTACERDFAPGSHPKRSGRAKFDIGPTHGAADSLRALAATHGVVALPPATVVRKELVTLGQALAFDPLLSGNRNMASMTCPCRRSPQATAKALFDRRKGNRVGTDRAGTRSLHSAKRAAALQPRRAQSTLGRARSHGRLPHTGGTRRSRWQTTQVFEFAIGLFPVTFVLGDAWRGRRHHEVHAQRARADSHSDFTGIWKALMARLGAIPEYKQLVPGGVSLHTILVDDVCARVEWMADSSEAQLSFANTPWDHFLAGDDAWRSRRSSSAARTCSRLAVRRRGCYNRALFTDAKTRKRRARAIRSRCGSTKDDFGRITAGVATDKYSFKTLALRNVDSPVRTQRGEFATLRGFVDHYSESDVKLANYDVSQIDPLLRGTLLPTTADILATRAGVQRPCAHAAAVDDLTYSACAHRSTRARSQEHHARARAERLTPPGVRRLACRPSNRSPIERPAARRRFRRCEHTGPRTMCAAPC